MWRRHGQPGFTWSTWQLRLSFRIWQRLFPSGLASVAGLGWRGRQSSFWCIQMKMVMCARLSFLHFVFLDVSAQMQLLSAPWKAAQKHPCASLVTARLKIWSQDTASCLLDLSALIKGWGRRSRLYNASVPAWQSRFGRARGMYAGTGHDFASGLTYTLALQRSACRPHFGCRLGGPEQQPAPNGALMNGGIGRRVLHLRRWIPFWE